MGMTRDSSGFSVHPPGEQSLVVENERPDGVDLDSFFGPVRVEWDYEAALTPLGQLPFFIHFLKTSGLFDALVADCPLRYGSPNAPKKRDVLGTAMLAMLAGHKRYAHIAALRRGPAGAARHEQDRQRGCGPPGLQGDRGEGRRAVAAPASCLLRGAASGRAVDPRRRYDDQAALWPSGRSGLGLQPQEARTSEALL